MKKANLEAIKQHAAECYPAECCGLLVSKDRVVSYVSCKNQAKDLNEHFVISPEEYAAAEDMGNIVGVVHSHPDATTMPSAADRAYCNASGVRWYILSWPEGELGILEPENNIPLLGRNFVHGVQDCASIIIDYYQRELGIAIGAYDRDDNWWNEGGNLYLDNLPKAGFYQVDTPRDGDIILMQIRSPVPNHAAIYLEHGTLKSERVEYPMPGTILHHLYGRLSGRDVYAGGMFEEKTVSIWRHRDRS